MFGTDDLMRLVVPRVAIAGNVDANLRFVGDNPATLADRFKDLKQQQVGAVADKNAIVLAPDTPRIEAFRIFCRSRASLAVVGSQDSASSQGSFPYWDVMGAITAGA